LSFIEESEPGDLAFDNEEVESLMWASLWKIILSMPVEKCELID
jgi:hypothetical protein